MLEWGEACGQNSDDTCTGAWQPGQQAREKTARKEPCSGRTGPDSGSGIATPDSQHSLLLRPENHCDSGGLEPSPPVGPRHRECRPQSTPEIPVTAAQGPRRCWSLQVLGRPGRGLAARFPGRKVPRPRMPGPRSCAAGGYSFRLCAVRRPRRRAPVIYSRRLALRGRCAWGCCLAKSCLPFEIKWFSKELSVDCSCSHLQCFRKRELSNRAEVLGSLFQQRRATQLGSRPRPQHRTFGKVCSVKLSQALSLTEMSHTERGVGFQTF